ncbi:hypothetical protein BH11ACT6_BH11ACT6_33340 [soil metagenome]
MTMRIPTRLNRRRFLCHFHYCQTGTATRLFGLTLKDFSRTAKVRGSDGGVSTACRRTIRSPCWHTLAGMLPGRSRSCRPTTTRPTHERGLVTSNGLQTPIWPILCRIWLPIKQIGTQVGSAGDGAWPALNPRSRCFVMQKRGGSVSRVTPRRPRWSSSLQLPVIHGATSTRCCVFVQHEKPDSSPPHPRWCRSAITRC